MLHRGRQVRRLHRPLTADVTNLDIGPNPGQVRIVSESPTGYELEAVSRAKTAGANHRSGWSTRRRR